MASRCEVTLKSLWSSNVRRSLALLGVWERTSTKQDTISPHLNRKLSLKPRFYTVLRPLEQALNQQTGSYSSKQKTSLFLTAGYWLMNTVFPICLPTVSLTTVHTTERNPPCLLPELEF